MRFRHRRASELDEGESYYVSMTDLMVGVLFIFIILLAYFALHFRDTTAELTQAKDAQTTALLSTATALRSRQADIEVDYAHRVVCLRDTDLLESGGTGERRCFAYSGVSPTKTQDQNRQRVEAAQALFAAALETDMKPAQATARVELGNGNVSFDAERLFLPGTSQLSPEGRMAAQTLAHSLAQRLPCHAYGVEAKDCADTAPLQAVTIVASASLNAFTPQGRAVQALALERSVVFHQALIETAPLLGQLRAQAQGTEPLLRVAAFGNSSVSAPVEGSGKVLSVQFQFAIPAP